MALLVLRVLRLRDGPEVDMSKGSTRLVPACYNLAHPINQLLQIVMDSGSQKVQHNLDVISHKIEAILKTRIDVSTNSTDLEWVPGTRSIGDEFVKTSILLIKL